MDRRRGGLGRRHHVGACARPLRRDLLDRQRAVRAQRQHPTQSFVGIDQRNADWTLTDLWVDAPQSPDGVHPDIRIEGEGEDRVIRGTIPAHGCLWFALD